APLGEELLGSVSAEECNPTAGALIVPVVEAALANVEATNISELGIGTGHQECRIVVVAVDTNVSLLQFRNCILAIGGLGLHCLYVRVFPANQAPSAGSAGLQAGAAVEDDHDVLAQSF